VPTKPVIHVIDDDPAMRDSLVFLLEVNDYQTRSHPSANAFLACAGGSAIDCVVSDIRMPGMNGLELVRKLAAYGFACPVIVITGHGDVGLAVEVMRAGAFEFIEKPFSDETLLAAIRSALETGSGENRDEAARLKAEARLVDLSPRERDVLAGLVAGKVNKVIGDDLGISAQSVEIYRANLMVKTGAGSISELMRVAITAGF
jgi:two-component system, LuxR family, response regulator FixJ